MSDVAIDAAILTVGGIASTLFVVVYWVVARWYRSEYGRASWTIMLAIALLIDVSLVAFWFGWAIPEWIARTIYVLISLGCCLKLGALVDEQIRKPLRRLHRRTD